MEETEKQEGGISLGDIFRTIFSQKWLALIIAAIITIGGTIGLYFYGRSKSTYSVTFVLHLPDTGDESTTSYTYPDGESLYYTDIISYDNLKAVSDDKNYQSVDVDKIIKEGGISIVRALDEVTSSGKVEVYDLVYTISVKTKYFSSEDAANDFIIALTEIPGKHIASMNINYDRNLTASQNALTYELQLNELKNQMLYLQSKYNSFISVYGSDFILSDGETTLATSKSEIDKYIGEDIFGTLKTEAVKNGYVKSADASSDEYAKYESDIYNKRLELEVEEKARESYIKSLQDSGSNIFSDEQLYNHEIKIAKINQEIEILQRYIDSFGNAANTANANYEARIKKVEDDVRNFTDEIKPVASYLYGKVTKVNQLGSSLNNGMGLIKSFVLSFVVGVVLALIVAYIVGWCRKHKTVTVEKPADIQAHQAQLQLAMTDESSENSENQDKE